MNITDFISIGIIGAIWSCIHAAINAQFNIDSTNNRVAVIAAAVVIGIAYTLLRQTVWWETILGVLGSASAVYAIFIKDPTSPTQ